MFHYLIPLCCQGKIRDFPQEQELFRCPSLVPLQHLRQIILKWKRDAFSSISPSKMSLKYDIAEGQAGKPVITGIRDHVSVLLRCFQRVQSHSLLSLNTAQVHLSRVSLCDHFSQPPTDCSLHVSWNNMDSSFSSACLACTERLRIIIHHRDKLYPFCYSQNTFHCQSLAYLTVMPDGWFTPLLFLQRCRSLVLTLSDQAAKCYNLRSDTENENEQMLFK